MAGGPSSVAAGQPNSSTGLKDSSSFTSTDSYPYESLDDSGLRHHHHQFQQQQQQQHRLLTPGVGAAASSSSVSQASGEGGDGGSGGCAIGGSVSNASAVAAVVSGVGVGGTDLTQSLPSCSASSIPQQTAASATAVGVAGLRLDHLGAAGGGPGVLQEAASTEVMQVMRAAAAALQPQASGEHFGMQQQHQQPSRHLQLPLHQYQQQQQQQQHYHPQYLQLPNPHQYGATGLQVIYCIIALKGWRKNIFELQTFCRFPATGRFFDLPCISAKEEGPQTDSPRRT